MAGTDHTPGADSVEKLKAREQRLAAPQDVREESPVGWSEEAASGAPAEARHPGAHEAAAAPASQGSTASEPIDALTAPAGNRAAPVPASDGPSEVSSGFSHVAPLPGDGEVGGLPGVPAGGVEHPRALAAGAGAWSGPGGWASSTAQVGSPGVPVAAGHLPPQAPHPTGSGSHAPTSQPPVPHAAVISGVDHGGVTEDATTQATGKLLVQDPDAGQAFFMPQGGVAGQHGHFSLTTDGSWRYVLDNASPGVQALKVGEVLTETFSVQTADGTAHAITVTITGSNDAPSLLAQERLISEDGSLLVGRLHAADIDQGDALTFHAGTPVEGFAITADGRYTFDARGPAYQHLAAGQTQLISIPVTVTDAAGAQATQNLLITVVGRNDGATISGIDQGAVTEDHDVQQGLLQTHGHLSVVDVDDGESRFVPEASLVGAHGHLSIDEQGAWTYQVDNSQPDVQRLGQGETLSEQFTVHSVDGTAHTITVNVVGSNDAPVLSAQSHAVTEDGQLLTGHMLATDTDAGDHLSYAIQTPVAGLQFGADGSFRFDPSDAAYQHLAAGQRQVLDIPVTVTDGQGGLSVQSLRIEVTGTNDAAQVSGAQLGVVTEDGSSVQSVQVPVMTFGPQRDGAVMTMGQLATGDLTQLSAEFTVVSDGQAIQSNHHGATFISYASHQQNNEFYIWRPDNLTVAIGDQEHPTGINIDDGRSHRVSMVWDSATGSLDVLVDGVVRHHADGYQQGYVIAGGGTVVLGQDQDQHVINNGNQAWGDWGFDLDDAFIGKMMNASMAGHAVSVHDLANTPLAQCLAQDPSLLLNIQADGQGQITDTTGHHQLMTYPGTSVQTMAVDAGVVGTLGIQHIVGALQVQDVDDGQAAFQAMQNLQGLYGSFTVDAAGHWSYTLDNARPQVQALVEGQQVSDTFVVHTIDGGSAPVTVTVIGRDDAPQVSGVDVGRVTEDTQVDAQGHLAVSGGLQAIDVDAGQSGFQAALIDGRLGHLRVDEHGQWTYEVDNQLPAVQALKTGQVVNEQFIVRTVDGTEHVITVSVAGQDEGPAVIGGVDRGSLQEDGPLQSGFLRTQGQLSIHDADPGESVFQAQTSVQGQHGQFSIDEQGAWRYQADNANPAIQSLKAGDHLSDSFTVHSADGTAHTVSVTIEGSNDTPQLLVRSHSVAEDGSLVSGQVRVEDPDVGDSHTVSTTAQVAGFTLHADGSYTFDPSDAAYQHLAQGQKLTLNIPITVTDSLGAHSTQPLIIGLTGSNDRAVITGVDQGTVTEDTQAHASGRLTVTDVDDTQATFQAQSGVTGAHGSLTLAADGSWTYALDNANPAVQSLKAGDHLSDSFTVHSADGTAHTVSVTIEGSNDAPTVSHVVTAQTATEDAAFSFSVPRGTFADIDTGDTLTLSTGSLPAWLHFDASTGTFSGTPANGDVGTLPVTVIATDASGTQVSTTFDLVVNNTNDAPTLNPIAAVRVTEDGTQAKGQFTATDPDTGDHLTFSTSATVGGLTIHPDGSWAFDPAHASYQHLAAGQHQDVVIPITVTDSAGATSTQNLTITVTGANDGAVITGTDIGAVTEDTRLSASGRLTVTDVDDTQAAFQAQSGVTGAHGSFALAADGSWTYALDNANPAVQSLKAGDHLSDSFTVHSADGTAHTVSVTIEGSNDTPQLLVRSHSVNEDGSRVSGQVRVDDPDVGDSHTVSTTAQVAGFTLHADGSYTFDPSDAAYQHLAQGQKLTLNIPITVTDSQGAHSTQPLIIGLTGSNDRAVITGVDQGTVTEDKQVHASGRLTVTDVDDTQATFQAQSGVTGAHGSFTLAADGSWTYALDNANPAVQSLKAGDHLSDSFTVHSADGTAHTVSVTIEGSNDAPTLSAINTLRITEDGAQATGQFTATDPDAGDQLSYSVTTPVDGLTVNADGSWRFDPSHASYQQLAAGQTQVLTIPVTVTDATGATSTQDFVIKVNGRNDGAVIGGIDTGTVTEDQNAHAGRPLQTSGTLTVTDVDAGQTVFQATSVTGQLGRFILHQDGGWMYQADNANPAIQALKAGDHLSDSFTVHSADGTAHTVVVTIEGSNDAPVLQAQTQSVTEDGTQLSGHMVATDVDTGDTQAFSIAQPVAGFVLNADGSYTFDPSDAAYQHLSAGQHQDVVIPITVTDGAGATSTQNLTISVRGANDGAVITGFDVGLVKEDGRLRTTGQLTATDIDDQQAAFQPQVSTAGQHGSFSLDGQGEWSYRLDNADPAVQALREGQRLTDVFDVKSVDGATHTVSVTIEGSNDTPQLLVRSHSVNEDGSRVSGQVRVDDPDVGDGHTVSTTAQVAGFTLHADGSYTFDPSDAAYQHLAQGQKLTLNIPITVTDSLGAHSTQPLIIGLTGSNDRAVITGVDQGAVTEDSQLTTGGRLRISDVDDQQAVFTPQSHVAGGHGSFTLAADGSWTYALDNQDRAVQALGKGDTLTDRFTAFGVDGTPHQVVVSINGADESPHLITRVEHAIENGRLIQGQLQMDAAQSGHTYTYSMATPIPGFTLQSDGTYYFSPSYVDYQHLREGELFKIRVPVTVSDGHGLQVTELGVLINLRGANDPAIISGRDHASVTEDQVTSSGQLQTSGRLHVSDLDTGEDHFVSQHNVLGHHGSLSIDEHGSWVYTADNSQPDIQRLNAGDMLTDAITVESVDGTTHEIDINILGVDEPMPPALRPPGVIQAPPGSHVLQPNLVQSGDIFEQLIDAFLNTNVPAYVAAARAMQAGNSWSLYTVELTVQGAGLLLTDDQGNVSTQQPVNPFAGSSTINLGQLVDFHALNPGANWVQVYDPQRPGSNQIKPWLHNVGDDQYLSVHYLGQGGTTTSPMGQVTRPIGVTFFAPTGSGSAHPAPPDVQHDDPTAALDDTHAVVVDVDAGHAAHDSRDDQARPSSDHSHDSGGSAADYLRFADMAQPEQTHDSATSHDGSAADVYLSVLGVDPAHTQAPPPEHAGLPPDEALAVMADAHTVGGDVDALADATPLLDAVHTDLPPTDDPSAHHGA